MYQGDKYNAWVDYYTYGGMPVTRTLSSHEQKSQYLKDLFTRTYLKDVVERHAIQNDTEVLEDLLNIIASVIGSLTNPTKLSNTFDSEKHLKISSATIDKYLGYFRKHFCCPRRNGTMLKEKNILKLLQNITSLMLGCVTRNWGSDSRKRPTLWKMYFIVTC